MTEQSDPFKKDTPAGRAYQIFRKAECAGGTKIRERWAITFALHPSNDASIRYHVAQLISLLAQAQRDFDATSHSDGFSDPITPLITALAHPNLDKNWPDIGNVFDQARGYLTSAAAVSKEALDAPPVDAEQLAKWQTEIDALIAEVLGVKVADDLREFIVEHLTFIKNAIVSYRLQGSEGLARTFRASMFAMLMRNDEINEQISKEDPKKPGPITKLMAFMSTMYTALRHAKQIGEFLPGAAEALKQITDGSTIPPA